MGKYTNKNRNKFLFTKVFNESDGFFPYFCSKAGVSPDFDGLFYAEHRISSPLLCKGEHFEQPPSFAQSAQFNQSVLSKSRTKLTTEIWRYLRPIDQFVKNIAFSEAQNHVPCFPMVAV